MPTSKPTVKVLLTETNRDRAADLASRLGFSSTSALGRALLKDLFEKHGVEWDPDDRVEQWGNYHPDTPDRRQIDPD